MFSIPAMSAEPERLFSGLFLNVGTEWALKVLKQPNESWLGKGSGVAFADDDVDTGEEVP